MVAALVDTNILIDYLHNHPGASAELKRYNDLAISSVTWIEIMVGAAPSMEGMTRDFLNRFALVPLDDAVSERAVFLRRTHRLKMPDAITLASAHVTGRLFITRDATDFSKVDPGIRIPYKI